MLRALEKATITVGGALVASLTLVLAGCPTGTGAGATCQSSADCSRNPLTECVEGVCTAVMPTPAPACEADTDCGDRETCSDGVCALTPSCQRIDGDFRFHARCPFGDISGIANAVTDDCVVTFSGGAGAQFQIGFAQVPAVNALESDLLLLAGCAGTGRWAVGESAALLSDCTLAGDTCDVVLIADELGVDPCFDNGDCTAGCAPLSQLQGGTGTCQ